MVRVHVTIFRVSRDSRVFPRSRICITFVPFFSLAFQGRASEGRDLLGAQFRGFRREDGSTAGCQRSRIFVHPRDARQNLPALCAKRRRQVAVDERDSKSDRQTANATRRDR